MFSFSKYISCILYLPVILLIFLCLFFVPILSTSSTIETFSPKEVEEEIDLKNKDFLWPSPGYTRITCPFGYRKAPTAGASNYHSGIDIAVPTGANLVSSISGTIIYTGFNGANGYTLKIQNGNFIISYSHISPEFLVSVGDTITKGKIIAKVGPLYVYHVPNNPYKDKTGKPTNGATTGPHLHFKIEKSGKAVNPLEYL